MKIELTKEFRFEMAHALHGYDGPCKNIHGHSYILFVTVSGEPITDKSSPKLGMVMDFGELKRIVNTLIIEPFDHALVLSAESPMEISMPTKLIRLDFQPTCENLLLYFAELIRPLLPKEVQLKKLKLHETATSFAEVSF